MNLSTLTVYFLLLRIYPVIAVKDSDDLVIRESSYVNVIQDAIATGEHDRSKLLSGKNRLGGDFERKDFLHAKKDQANNNRIGAKRVKKGKFQVISKGFMLKNNNSTIKYVCNMYIYLT